jgi:hypothetical protein
MASPFAVKARVLSAGTRFLSTSPTIAQKAESSKGNKPNAPRMKFKCLGIAIEASGSQTNPAPIGK